MKLQTSNRQLVKGNRQGWLMLIVVSITTVSLLPVFSISCKTKKQEDHSQHRKEVVLEEYTCPMHPQIIRNEPGDCPICGMQLVKKEKEEKIIEEISLGTLLRPSNEYVIATLPLVSAHYREEPMEIEALGYTAYNTSSIGIISARISGRIEKLYVKFRYQKINKGQKILDIYSPELLTAQQNLLFLLKNDAENTSMIEAAKQRLLLLGFSSNQLQQLIQTGRSFLTVTVYSNYSGHIHEANEKTKMFADQPDAEMNKETQTTQELNLREGMYLQKGQSIFSVYDPNKLWILLNIHPQDQVYVKPGNSVRVVPEARPGQDFRASINYIEPFFRKGSKTIAARINYDNSSLKLPVGSQVKATIFPGPHKGIWLPKEAVLSLGQDKVVFLKSGGVFKTHPIQTGHEHKKLVLVTGGLQEKDSVAANAQYLIDSESFIKVESKL